MADPITMQAPNDLMVAFSTTVSAGFVALQGAVNGVFATMIALVVALTGIQWSLSAHREVLAQGFAKVMLIGAFAFLINDWQSLAETIYAGFVQLGLTAGGATLTREQFLNPGAVLAQGWRIVKALGDAPSGDPLDVVGNLTDALIIALAMLGVMLAFAMLALQIVVSLLEFKIVTLGGFVLLPFGIWSKSAFLAERPLGFVVSSGLKVLALAIVISGAQAVFDRLQPSAAPDIYEALSLLVAAVLLAMLALFIPNLAAALVTGGPSLAAGSVLTGALAVGGTGALTLAGLSSLGAAAARISAPARAAAGAGGGRPPPAAPGPRPGPGSGGTPPSWPPAGPAGGGDRTAPVAGSGRAAGGAPGRAASVPGGAAAPSERAREQVAQEAETARRAFHRAARGSATQGAAGVTDPAAGEGGPRGPAATRERRSAALQAFFLANAGRSLLPASEGSGALTPDLKNEEP